MTPELVLGAATGENHGMGLLDRLRRWWSPAQWNEDHPLAADERATEGRRSSWWSDAQNVEGANTWGKVDSDRDFKKPRP